MIADSIASLNSGKVKRQIFSLDALAASGHHAQIQTSLGLINSLIDHGICSDNATVRAKSIILVRIVYQVRIVRWIDVRNGGNATST